MMYYLFRLTARRAVSFTKSELFTLAEEVHPLAPERKPEVAGSLPSRFADPAIAPGQLRSLTRVARIGPRPAANDPNPLGGFRRDRCRSTLILQENPSERNSQCPPMRSFDARATGRLHGLRLAVNVGVVNHG